MFNLTSLFQFSEKIMRIGYFFKNKLSKIYQSKNIFKKDWEKLEAFNYKKMLKNFFKSLKIF